MKIIIDRDLCIGAAPCVALLPEIFELDEEGKAVLTKEAEKKLEKGGITLKQVIDAAEACPVSAISVFDDEGKQIYP